jgi:phage shock protein PspC (stress-responsive transcriptional regulator)
MTGQDTPPRARIRRDTTNGMIGGVAAGFARHLDVDVVWVRLAFVLLTVFGGGVGLVAYLAAWLIVPEGEATDGAASSRNRNSAGRGGAFWTGVVLVTIGGIILLDTILEPLGGRIGWGSTSDIIFPLVLIGIGTLVYRSSRDGELVIMTERIADIDRDAESLGERIEERVERWGEEVERVTEDWETRIELRAQARREARSQARVAPTTFGVAFITLGGLWLASSLDVPGITLPRAFAATLLVIGTGLVVGAFLGRGRGLIVAGALLVPVVAVAALVPQIPDGLEWISVGPDGVLVSDAEERTETPSTLAALPADATYEFGAGSFTLDLRELGEEIAAAGTVTVTVEMGVGSLRIRVPDGVIVIGDISLGIGRIQMLGAPSGGIGVTEQRTVTVGDGSGGELVLVVRQGIGGISVTL